MIPRDYITEWRTQAPWVQDFQVEQDLVISRALVEMFSHPLLAQGLAFRGATAIDDGRMFGLVSRPARELSRTAGPIHRPYHRLLELVPRNRPAAMYSPVLDELYADHIGKA